MQEIRSKARAFFFLLACLFSVDAHAFNRIVTLAPVISEWTAEVLGVDQAKQNLVGVSEYSNYPAELKTIQTIGSYPKVDVEKIASLKPDLIIASTEYNRADQLEQLKRLHLNLKLLPKEKFSEMPDWIKKLGTILSSDSRANRVASRWESEVAILKKSKRTVSQTVFLEIQHDPLVSIGGDSFLNDALALVGYENIFKSLAQSYPKVSKEAVLKKKPQQIFILDLTGNATDFAAPVADWEKYGYQPKVVSGDEFARCSFLLLKGLRGLL